MVCYSCKNFVVGFGLGSVSNRLAFCSRALLLIGCDLFVTFGLINSK